MSKIQKKITNELFFNKEKGKNAHHSPIGMNHSTSNKRVSRHMEKK